MEMNALLNLSVAQLKGAADIKQRIDDLNNELASLLSGGNRSGDGLTSSAPKSGRRSMSASAKARISAAAKARWAKFRAAKGGTASKASSLAPTTKKRTMSAAARAKIAAAQRARWAKQKQA